MMAQNEKVTTSVDEGRPGFFKTGYLVLRSESAAKFFSLVLLSATLICIDYFFLKEVNFFRGIDPSGRFHLVLSAAIVLFPVGMAFWYAKNCFSIYNLMKDLPSSKIRSAPQGLVELCGKAFLCSEGAELYTPYTREPAVWRRAYTIFTETVRNGNSSHRVTRVVHSFEDNHLCGINDGSGVAYFYPHLAKIKGVKENVVKRGAYTYVEYWISAHDPLYLVGNFKTVGRDEFLGDVFSAERPKHWLRRISLAFRRRKNSDALVNQRSYFEALQDRKFNVLNKWESNGPFFLSHRDEILMLTEYRFWGGAFVALGLGSGFLVLSLVSFN